MSATLAPFLDLKRPELSPDLLPACFAAVDEAGEMYPVRDSEHAAYEIAGLVHEYAHGKVEVPEDVPREAHSNWLVSIGMLRTQTMETQLRQLLQHEVQRG